MDYARWYLNNLCVCFRQSIGLEVLVKNTYLLKCYLGGCAGSIKRRIMLGLSLMKMLSS